MTQEQLSKKQRIGCQEIVIRTPEDKILASRCRELMDRFGLDQPAEIAVVLRISLQKAEQLLRLAKLR